MVRFVGALESVGQFFEDHLVFGKGINLVLFKLFEGRWFFLENIVVIDSLNMLFNGMGEIRVLGA